MIFLSPGITHNLWSYYELRELARDEIVQVYEVEKNIQQGFQLQSYLFEFIEICSLFIMTLRYRLGVEIACQEIILSFENLC